VVAHGEIVRPAEDGSAAETFLATVVEARPAAENQPLYFLPLAAIWSPAETELRQGLTPVTLAELRQLRREGALIDAVWQEGFAFALLNAIRCETTIPLEGGELRCSKTSSFGDIPLPERLTVRSSGAEQTHGSALFEEYGMLKIYRRLQRGPHPEIEMPRYLVERAGFANTPPLLATIELALDRQYGETHALGALFGFVRNQGDGWTHAQNYLSRYLDDSLLATGDGSELPDPDVFFLMQARQLGIRTAEMHRALAEQAGGDPDFMPEPITAADVAEWRDELAGAAAEMLSRLESAGPSLPAAARELAERLLASREELFDLVFTLMPDGVSAQKTRFHGNYHLAHVIVVQNDFFIVDFAGEPGLPFAERRRKSSPLRDVAGMIRSFDYATVAAVRHLAEARPAAEPRMAELAESWRQRAVDGFRAAYRKTMRGCAAYPANKTQEREMTAFFALQKAVDEVSYELANRPDWVEIPLRGILAILARPRKAERAPQG
jgi:maltose alpha-D-glucosyltransferase / alpha-amylase